MRESKILDGEGRIQFYNEKGLQLMEIDSIDHVRGVYWPSLWPNAGRKLAQDSLEAARKHGVAHFIAQFPTAKGSLKWWDVTVAAMPGPTETFTVISRDINDEHMAKLEERVGFERLRAIMGSNTDVLWDIDLQNDKVG
jgi:PAS domain-containing protein